MGNWDVELNQARETLRNAAWLGTDEERELIEKAVELLCGEPCEDAISRDAVLALPRNKIRDFKTRGGVVCETINVTDIETLPPVTPKRRTGHWILVSDGTPGGYWKCSECLMHKRMPGRLDSFCSCCGADMRESEG